MFIIIEDNRIAAAAAWDMEGSVEVETTFEDYCKNPDKYAIVQGVFTDISQTQEYLAAQLQKAKEVKLAKNIEMRDERLRAGIWYKGVLFDSDTDSKVNIMGAVSVLPEDATVGWNSMDNETVLLTKSELNELGNLLVALTSDIWGEEGLNVQYINAINSAKSIEEVDAIEIDYSLI